MSLGQPDLYIAGQKMQTAKNDPRPALAGLSFDWGTDSRVDFAGAATLSGQLLIRGAMPSYLNPGAQVGLVDPASSRTLFAGYLQPLKASNEPGLDGAMRVQFTAASPLAELEKHTMTSIDFPGGESAAGRRWQLAQRMPAGWSLLGDTGHDWLNQGVQRYPTVSWLDMLERFARGNLLRYHDTSAYVPAHGLNRRITLARERGLTATAAPKPAARGSWVTGRVPYASGLAVLPAATVSKDIEWEKTPADITTAVQVSTNGVVLAADETESREHEYPLNWAVFTQPLIDAHGFHATSIATSIDPQDVAAAQGAVRLISEQWLDVETEWRPTNLTIPDSRLLDTEPLRNLLAVDTRHMAAVAVPDAPAGPGRIYAFVMAGTATWTGKHWQTQLTLGKTL